MVTRLGRNVGVAASAPTVGLTGRISLGSSIPNDSSPDGKNVAVSSYSVQSMKPSSMPSVRFISGLAGRIRSDPGVRCCSAAALNSGFSLVGPASGNTTPMTLTSLTSSFGGIITAPVRFATTFFDVAARGTIGGCGRGIIGVGNGPGASAGADAASVIGTSGAAARAPCSCANTGSLSGVSRRMPSRMPGRLNGLSPVDHVSSTTQVPRSTGVRLTSWIENGVSKSGPPHRQRCHEERVLIAVSAKCRNELFERRAPRRHAQRLDLVSTHVSPV